FILPSFVYVAASNLFTSLIFAILLVFAVRTLHLRPATIGLIFSIASIGSLLGALTATRIARRFGIGRTLIAASMNAWPSLLIPLASRSTAIPFLVIAELTFTFGATVYNVTAIRARRSRLIGYWGE